MQLGRRAGHAPERLKVGLHLLGYLADHTEQAALGMHARSPKSEKNAVGRQRRVRNLMCCVVPQERS